MSSKVINTILKLQDRMSQPMKNAAAKVEEARKQVELAKKAVKKLQIATVKHEEVINNTKQKIKELSEKYGKNSYEVKKARIALKKYKLQATDAKEKLKAAEKNVKSLDAALKKSSLSAKVAKDKLKKLGTTIKKSITRTIKKAVKTIATLGTAIATLGFGIGFKESFNLEGYKSQLETATKSTEKAGKLMSNAIKFANSTNFENGEVVEATAKMESYGISSTKWLVDVADMAGATNKSIDQATEAMADGVMGEFERLKEFGIKKEMLIAKAAKEYGEGIVFNKRGQILDRIKLEDVLQKTMQTKFKGGAAKQAESAKGLWSTITGVVKSSLSKIVGMQEDGTIRQGSLYDKLKIQMKKVVDILNKWQSDGTIDKIATQVTNAVTSMINIVKNVVGWINKYQDALIFLGTAVGTIYTVIKAYEAWQTTIAALKMAHEILNAVMAANPIGFIIGAIILAIPLIVTLAKKFKGFRNLLKGIGAFIKMAVKGTCEIIKALFNPFKAISKLIDKIKGTKKAELKVSEKKSVNINSKSDPSIVPVGASTPISTPISNSSKNVSVVINMNGDFYGWEDFKEQVSKAVVEAFKNNSPNVVGVN